jgi:hypothetical protein
MSNTPTKTYLRPWFILLVDLFVLWVMVREGFFNGNPWVFLLLLLLFLGTFFAGIASGIGWVGSKLIETIDKYSK